MRSGGRPATPRLREIRMMPSLLLFTLSNHPRLWKITIDLKFHPSWSISFTLTASNSSNSLERKSDLSSPVSTVAWRSSQQICHSFLSFPQVKLSSTVACKIASRQLILMLPCQRALNLAVFRVHSLIWCCCLLTKSLHQQSDAAIRALSARCSRG